MELGRIPLLTYSRARTAGYTLERGALNWVARFIPNALDKAAELGDETRAELQRSVDALLRQDAENIRHGLYPITVLAPESPVTHLRRLASIAFDGVQLFNRRRKGRTAVFTPGARELLEDVPRYYRRNFHFQTDGYLSAHSAELYNHQVELLFGGTADPMRRLILPPLRRALTLKGGAGLKILEVGAGTGRATRFVRQAFPRAKITAVDLSDPYLRHAERASSDLPRIDFVRADGADLPFKLGTFDAVFSVFLFHELPMEARVAVLSESMRVLKPGGFLGFVESIQLGDVEPFDPLLEMFPKNYHEPFYRDYISHPMEALLKAQGIEGTKTEIGFLSKVSYGKKPQKARKQAQKH
jgi:SAM-dependent methyltransferase